MRLITWLKHNRPSREAMVANRWLRPFATTLGNPNVWHFNRRSVARGVALGMFCGILVPLGQSIAAAMFALPARANLAVAVLCTFITNPITTPLVYAAAYKVGEAIVVRVPYDPFGLGNLPEGLSKEAIDMLVYVPFGLIVLSTAAAALGYGIIHVIWRMWVFQRIEARRRRHLHPKGEAR